MQTKRMFLSFIVLITLLLSHQGFSQACGNSNEGQMNPDEPPEDADPVQTYTGSEFRDIKDLKIWGGVGLHQLVWERWGNSRNPGSTTWFGNGHSWRHGYQWEMVNVAASPTGAAQVQIYYPEGAAYTFQAGNTVSNGPEQAGSSPTLWQPINTSYQTVISPLTGELLYQNGKDFYLQRSSGYVYHFTQTTSGTSTTYLMTDFFDPANNQYLLTYNKAKLLTKVSEPGGRFLTINYTNLSLNNLPFTTLATISAVPAANQWTTLPVTATKAYRYLRYLSPDSSYGDIADVQFYDTNGNLLTGTPIGSGPAGAPGTDFTQALDGNPSTYFDSSVPTGNFVGIDLGPKNTAILGSVKFYPRPGYESRTFTTPNLYAAKTGTFQGGNQAPATSTVISSVTTSDGRTVTYNYQPFNDPTLPWVFQVLAGATYDDGTQAVYTSTQIEPGTRPLITAYVDPRYEGTAARSRTGYYLGTTVNFGQVLNQFNYDTLDKLITIGIGSGGFHNPTCTYGNGAVESYTMVNGKLGQKVDALGHKTTYTYANNGWGYLISTTDPLGRTTTFTPSIHGNNLGITHPDGSTENWVRDSKDLILSYTDQLGRVTSYARDGNHRITQATYPDSSTELWSYNNFGQILSHQFRNGAIESFTYGPTGLMLTKTDACGQVWTFGYNSSGLLSSYTDPRGKTTSYLYTATGQVSQETFADGSSQSFSYDLYGNRTSQTDELGHTTTYTYDPFRRLTSTTDPLARSKTWIYATNSLWSDHPLTVILPSGKTTTNTYDLEWNLLSTTVGAGTVDAATTKFTYDNAKRLTCVTDPDGHATSYTYDLLDRKLTAKDPLGYISKWSYDLAGNTLTTTRPDGGVTTNSYDSLNRLLTSTDPKNESITQTYSLGGELVSLQDSKGDIYSFTFDPLDHLTSTTYPDNTVESSTYDPAGNLLTHTTRAGKTKTSSYDARNREIAYTWSDGTPSVSKSYDLAGRLLSTVNQVSSTSYTYDNANQLLSETQQNDNISQNWVVGYQYDLDGNRTNLNYPSGLAVGYAYTNRNLVGSINVGGTPLANYTLDAAGNTLTKTLPNGTTVAYTYDSDGDVKSLINAHAGASFARFDYGYDVMKRLTYAQRNLLKGDNYAYDAVDQVTSVSYNNTNPGTTPSSPDRVVAYSYDPAGNWALFTDSTVASGSVSFLTNALNQYLTVGGTTYGYDGNGNLSSGNGSYLYDSENRLVSATVGTNLEQITYDSLNRAVERVVNGVSTYFVYDGQNLIEERSSTGTVQATYVLGAKQDELLTKTTSTGSIYYAYDSLGNVAGLTGSTGNLLEKYKYDAFGQPTITDGLGNPLTGSAYGNRFLFTGRDFRSEINLYDYRSRVYSPSLGRFLQVDPLRFDSGDNNFYRYVGNDPINTKDPFGTRGSVPGSSDGPGYVKPPPPPPEPIPIYPPPCTGP